MIITPQWCFTVAFPHLLPPALAPSSTLCLFCTLFLSFFASPSSSSATKKNRNLRDQKFEHLNCRPSESSLEDIHRRKFPLNASKVDGLLSIQQGKILGSWVAPSHPIRWCSSWLYLQPQIVSLSWQPIDSSSDPFSIFTSAKTGIVASGNCFKRSEARKMRRNISTMIHSRGSVQKQKHWCRKGLTHYLIR